MIGAVLHLWQRAVDRLAGADAASLRVMLAALSARVAAAEGEAARLRAELAGLRQTDHDVRTWCEQAADAMDAAYAAGFRYGVDHPGEAFRDACDLGVYLDDQRLRVEWAHGRQDEAAARRLGEDTRAMADAGVHGPSLTDPALVIVRLLDERDAARADLATLRRLAQVVVDDMTLCEHPGCMRFATRLACEHPTGMFCADHLNDRGVRRDIHHLLPDTALDDMAAALPAKETP